MTSAAARFAMAEDQLLLLGGRVWKRSLPVVLGPPPPDAPLLKRLRLDQGELAHFWNGEEPIRYLAALELRAGSVRGGHYHLRKREQLYVISGQISVLVEDTGSRRREAMVLQTGDLAMMDTRIAHIYHITEAGRAVEFSSSPFDASDVCPWRFE